MNVKFVVRGLILGLPVVVISVGVWVVSQTPFGSSPAPTPLPPTILAPTGDLPSGPVGMRVFARHSGEDYQPVGSGFFLALSSGKVVGVTAAHALSLDDSEWELESVAIGIDGEVGFIVECDTFEGQPGRPRTGDDMTVDYLLLHVAKAVPPQQILAPDTRGAPQPGERVSLASGLVGSGGRQIMLEGTVQSATDTAVWVLMDDLFNPYGMSGSPVLSQHTGRVVGMAVAVSPRRARLLLGLHPIGSLVRLAEQGIPLPMHAP